MIEYEPSAPYPWFVTFTPSTTYWLSRPLPPEIDGFAEPADPELLTPGARYSVSLTRRPTGIRCNVSLSITAPVVVDDVSMTEVVPVTCTVSVTPPTSMRSGRSTVCQRLTPMSLRSTALNP